MVETSGLITTVQQMSGTENNQITFCDYTLTAEYDNTVLRIATPVDICECTDRAIKFRIEKALWDTGSTSSCISERLARKMGLRPIDKGIGITAVGQIEIPYYLLDVHITDDIIFRNVKAAGFPMENHKEDFLIGMDIISRGEFNIKNINNKTVFTFKAVM